MIPTMKCQSVRLSKKVDELYQVADDLAHTAGSARELCQKVLAAPISGKDYLINTSALNNDGSPLQLCLSASSKGSALRIIGDPGCHLSSLAERYLCSKDALLSCVKASGANDIEAYVQQTLSSLIPQLSADQNSYQKGFVWLALSPDKKGIAAYFETGPLGKERGWQKATAWLDELLPAHADNSSVLETLAKHTTLASAGFEGSNPENLRAKLYFRLSAQISLADLGIEHYVNPQLMQFLQTAMGSFGVDREGLLLGLGFSVATGDIVDVKIDLCGHCLTHSNQGWLDVVSSLSATLNLAEMPLEKALNQHHCNVAFIGMGLDVTGQARLNVYLNKGSNQPAIESEKVPSRADVEAALVDGIHYLSALQNSNGSWSDYHLPVGVSDQWVSAYVGQALAKACRVYANLQGLQSAKKAAHWLTTERTYQAGWGYNAITGPDADSTAMAITLLQELSLPIQDLDREFLHQHWQTQEGALATFQTDNAWGKGHWDVTPFGYLALGKSEQARLKASFYQGLKSNQIAGGLWRSYWWKTPYYCSFITLEALQQLNHDVPETAFQSGETPHKFNVNNAFDLACAIGIQHFRAVNIERIAPSLHTLLAWQNHNGSWNGHDNLRVTQDNCEQPWHYSPTDEAVGKYYTDEQATITTATVVRTLALMLDHY